MAKKYLIVGGVAGGSATESSIISRYEGVLSFEELRLVKVESDEEDTNIVVSRMAELKILDKKTK